MGSTVRSQNEGTLYCPDIEGTIKILGDIFASPVISEVLKTMRLNRALRMFPRVRVGLSREALSGARPPSGPRPPPPRSQRTSLGLCTPWGGSEAEATSPEPHLTPPWGSPPRVHLEGVWDRHPPEMGWGHPWRSCRAVSGGKPGPPWPADSVGLWWVQEVSGWPSLGPGSPGLGHRGPCSPAGPGPTHGLCLLRRMWVLPQTLPTPNPFLLPGYCWALHVLLPGSSGIP